MIPASAFTALIAELDRRPLGVNHYRKGAGDGRSQAFGVVGKRGLPADYSRQNWHRPYLFKLLIDFADQHVTIPWNAVTVNMNYQAAPHYDRNNIGDSFLVAFGDYTGGELLLHTQDPPIPVDVCQKPLVMNFSTTLHSVNAFQGKRYSLVYYTYDLKGRELPPCSVRQINGDWKFFRGDECIEKGVGLPHPLHKRKISP